MDLEKRHIVSYKAERQEHLLDACRADATALTRAEGTLVSGFGFPISSGFWFLISGFEFLVSSFWSLVSGSWFLGSGFWFLVWDFGFLFSGFGLRVPGFWFRALSFWFQVSGVGSWGQGFASAISRLVSGVGFRLGLSGPRIQRGVKDVCFQS